MMAREIIEEVQLLIGDPHRDFHGKNQMLSALNRATNRISTRSRSIHESVYHPVVAGQYQYALPPGTLYIRKAKFHWGYWNDLNRGYFDDVEARAAFPGGGPPRTFSMWQNARSEKFVGGVYDVDNDASRVESRVRQITIPLIADERSIRIGDVVINLSAGHAESTVTSLMSADHPDFPTPVFKLAYSALQGGMKDRFDVGDEIRIVSPHTSGHALLIAPSPLRTDEPGEESIAAFVARRHRTITRDDMNNENDTLELDEEFNDTLMYEILHWARVSQDGLDATAQKYRVMANSEYLQAIPLVENRIHQNLNAWTRRLDGGGSVYRDVDVKPRGDGFNAVTVA